MTREEKIARVQLMCTEGFCNISVEDKAAIREVLHSMYDAAAIRTAVFDGTNLISDYGDRTLIETVKRCWLSRAAAVREIDEEDSLVVARRYERAAELLDRALETVR